MQAACLTEKVVCGLDLKKKEVSHPDQKWLCRPSKNDTDIGLERQEKKKKKKKKKIVLCSGIV